MECAPWSPLYDKALAANKPEVLSCRVHTAGLAAGLYSIRVTLYLAASMQELGHGYVDVVVKNAAFLKDADGVTYVGDVGAYFAQVTVGE